MRISASQALWGVCVDDRPLVWTRGIDMEMDIIAGPRQSSGRCGSTGRSHGGTGRVLGLLGGGVGKEADGRSVG